MQEQLAQQVIFSTNINSRCMEATRQNHARFGGYGSKGDEGIEIYNSFNVIKENETLTSIIKRFDEKFDPCKNTTVERYNFFMRCQSKDESLDEYVTILYNLATSCKFGELKESLVKDMFIIGMRNTNIKVYPSKREISHSPGQSAVCKKYGVVKGKVLDITKKSDRNTSTNN